MKHTVSSLLRPDGVTHGMIETTAEEIVPHAIAVLQAAGYKLVIVADCLGVEPYQSVTEPPAFDVSILLF